MQTTRLIVVTLIVMLFVSGCVSPKYAYLGQRTPLPNGSTEYEGPVVSRKPNWLGYVSMVLGTVAGSYAGYKSNMSIDGHVSPTGNAVCGGLVGGLAVGFLTLATGGKEYPHDSASAMAWVKNFDRDLIFISVRIDDSNRAKSITAINRNSDTAFHVKTIEDVEIFVKLFEGSQYTNQIISDAVTNINRSDLLRLLSLFSDTILKNQIKIAYARTSKTIFECSKAIELYPEVAQEATSKARTLFDSIRFIHAFDTLKSYSWLNEYGTSHLARLCITKDECRYYLQKMPASSHASEVRAKLVNELAKGLDKIHSIQELRGVADEAPDLSEQAERLAADIAIQHELYEHYLEAFPHGASSPRIRILYKSFLDSVQRQIDKDLPMFGKVVSELGKHVSRLASGVRSAATDAARLVANNEDLYRRLRRVAPYMSTSQKSLYQSYMDEWERLAIRIDNIPR